MGADTYPLLINSEENRTLIQKKDKCDKNDYIAAVACGVIGGMIDIFLVGMPGDSMLGNWTDQQVNHVVMGFASKLGWNPKAKNADNAHSAIYFLENKFRVNYDQRKPSDVNNFFNIAPNTHHMMSLAHSPDIVGLFFFCPESIYSHFIIYCKRAVSYNINNYSRITGWKFYNKNNVRHSQLVRASYVRHSRKFRFTWERYWHCDAVL